MGRRTDHAVPSTFRIHLISRDADGTCGKALPPAICRSSLPTPLHSQDAPAPPMLGTTPHIAPLSCLRAAQHAG
jgi:hypothetical protein